MGKPAARMGDMTVHGGSIVVGCPTVLIGNMPAARVGDMHVCPMVNPAPVPPPHVGGPIMPPGAVTVLIGGMPAACVGDMATCAGPPDTIAPPGCPTVLIGPGGGGGGGGGGGTSGQGQDGAGPGSTAGVSAELVSEAETEDHYLDVKFVDKGGFPITGLTYKITGPGNTDEQGRLSGRVRRTGLQSGSYDIELKAITQAKWSVEEAEVGDEVTLTCDVSGIEPGTPAKLTIFMKDSNSPQEPVTEIESDVNGDKIEGQWTFEVRQDLMPIQESRDPRAGYSSPSFFFIVEADGVTARSTLLKFKDYIELKLKDQDGNPLGNKNYRLTLSTGEVRNGTLDGQGHAKEENIPPGKVKIIYNVRGEEQQG